MGKAFKNQTKAIKDQGEKQRKPIQDKKRIKSIYKFTYDINDSPIVLKKETYNKLTEESFGKINNLDKMVDIDKLIFKYKGKTPDEDFSKLDMERWRN